MGAARTAARVGALTRHHDERRAALAASTASAEAARQVRVERLILHGVDNRDAQPRLVDEPVLLSDEIAAFFAQHIQAAAGRADWKARFREPAGDVAQLCAGLLAGHEAFVDASRRLAARLFAQMRPRTIAPGDFVAAVYVLGGNAEQRRVALLKLDPDRRLVRTFTTQGGRTKVTISANGNLLPDTARLQKCALLATAPAGDTFDITLLDTQAGPRTEGVAAFFYRGFLAAELHPSPRRCTRDFLRCTDAWLGTRHDVLSPADETAFYEARRAALCAEELDLAAFAAAALPRHPALRGELIDEAASVLLTTGPQALPGTALAVDPAVAGPVVSRVVLELDGGARLIVPAERFADLVRVEPARTADNKYRLVIESLTLREVSER